MYDDETEKKQTSEDLKHSTDEASQNWTSNLSARRFSPQEPFRHLAVISKNLCLFPAKLSRGKKLLSFQKFCCGWVGSFEKCCNRRSGRTTRSRLLWSSLLRKKFSWTSIQWLEACLINDSWQAGRAKCSTQATGICYQPSKCQPDWDTNFGTPQWRHKPQITSNYFCTFRYFGFFLLLFDMLIICS